MSEADRLAGALEHAKQVIRVFHDMGLPSERRDEIWAIYDRASPEMKVINDALAAYQASQSEGTYDPLTQAGDPNFDGAEAFKEHLAKEGEGADSPIDMILFCPSCGVQHIDEPSGDWANPPHRSHLCHACGHIWRPADVPTNGVRFIKTAGKADSPGPHLPAPPPPSAPEWKGIESAPRDERVLLWFPTFPGDKIWTGLRVDGAWFTLNGKCQDDEQPTLWLPLPAPPDTAQGSGSSDSP